MTDSRMKALKNVRAEISVQWAIAFIMVLVLLLVSGCGAKKKVPQTAHELLDPGQQRIAEWNALMHERHNDSEMEKLEAVNVFFNQLEFVDDLDHWGKEDYWSTPQEMLVSNGGDCEDFATAKYFTLRQLDIPDEKMRLIYVKALNLQEPHMVLGYYMQPIAEPLILDNLVTRILTASERPDLIPIYSFNGQGLWLAKKQRSERLGGAERLSLWQELRLRFSREAVAAPLPQ